MEGFHCCTCDQLIDKVCMRNNKVVKEIVTKTINGKKISYPKYTPISDCDYYNHINKKTETNSIIKRGVK